MINPMDKIQKAADLLDLIDLAQKGIGMTTTINTNHKFERRGNVVVQTTIFTTPSEEESIALMTAIAIMKEKGEKLPSLLDLINELTDED